MFAWYAYANYTVSKCCSTSCCHDEKSYQYGAINENLTEPQDITKIEMLGILCSKCSPMLGSTGAPLALMHGGNWPTAVAARCVIGTMTPSATKLVPGYVERERDRLE